MISAPLVDDLALLWIAVEITTVVSALLVALDYTEGATAAAWKYVLIASSGLGIALLATIFTYYAGAQVLGQSYSLALDPLIAAASQFQHTPVRLAFVLAVVGFGTKVGFFRCIPGCPTRMPEAPTPVSALLSGSLLAVSFYAILRYYQISVAALGPRFLQTVLLVFGVLSLLWAAYLQSAPRGYPAGDRDRCQRND
jgi:hydrogenase-4 component F